jgi:hypothetical protein
VWLTLLALAVSPTAFALNSDGSERVGANPAPASLNVSTSLDSCGLAGYQVVCKLDVSYSNVPGASSYTASITDANGTVIDYGSVGVGSTSLYVPYVGPGSYSVRITAYGNPPQSGGRGNVIATGSAHPAHATVSGARGNNTDTKSNPGARVHHAHAAEATQTHTPGNDAASQQPQQPNPPAEEATPAADPGAVDAPPPCDPELNPLPPDNDPNNDDEDADGVSDAQEFAAAAAGKQLTLPAPPGCAAP